VTTWRRPKEITDGFRHGGYVARRLSLGPWQKWFAWRPVKIQGRRTWMTTVYRRTVDTYVDCDKWQRYEYGTIFDLLKDSE
jgi:hypothetical protein